MNILIFGGCGYIGTVLVKELIENPKIKITVFDTQWFGNYLKKKKNLKIIKGDIRKLDKLSFKNFDQIIHLANIPNDLSVDLNPILSWETNVLTSKFIVEKAIKNKVKSIIFLSSGSVYGTRKEKKITEDIELTPISTYNKTKIIAERVFLSYKNKIKIFCIRPATVCGLSPRMRLDVSVNMLTFHALKKKEIKVFGGKQIRPNIHIKDLVRTIEHFMFKKNIEPGIYNAGFENMSIIKLAKKIIKIVPAKIKITKSNDVRSYSLDSTKLLKSGFKPLFSVDDAINEIKESFARKKNFFSKKTLSVKWLKKIVKK